MVNSLEKINNQENKEEVFSVGDKVEIIEGKSLDWETRKEQFPDQLEIAEVQNVKDTANAEEECIAEKHGLNPEDCNCISCRISLVGHNQWIKIKKKDGSLDTFSGAYFKKLNK